MKYYIYFKNEKLKQKPGEKYDNSTQYYRNITDESFYGGISISRKERKDHNWAVEKYDPSIFLFNSIQEVETKINELKSIQAPYNGTSLYLFNPTDEHKIGYAIASEKFINERLMREII